MFDSPAGSRPEARREGRPSLEREQDDDERNRPEKSATCGIDTTGLTGTGRVHYNLGRISALRGGDPPRRGEAFGAWRAGGRDRPAHRPLGQGQVHRPRRRHRGRQSGGATTAPCRARPSSSCWPTFWRMPRGRDLFVQDLVGGADPAQLPADARRHRICLALAVHPQPADPAGPRGARAFRAEDDDHRPAELPRRSGAPRLPQRNRHRHRPVAHAGADRRHLLCRRDEEVGVHGAQLSAAGKAASCRCTARPMSARTATPRSSSACRAPARRRSRPIRRAR